MSQTFKTILTLQLVLIILATECISLANENYSKILFNGNSQPKLKNLMPQKDFQQLDSGALESVFIGLMQDYRSNAQSLYGFLDLKTLQVFLVEPSKFEKSVQNELNRGRKILTQPIQKGNTCAAHGLVNLLSDLEANDKLVFQTSPSKNHSLYLDWYVTQLYSNERKDFSKQVEIIRLVLYGFGIKFKKLASNMLKNDAPLIDHLKKGGTALISFPANWKDYQAKFSYLRNDPRQDYTVVDYIEIVTPGGKGDGIPDSSGQGHFAYIRGIVDESAKDPILIIQDSHTEIPTFWRLSDLNPDNSETDFFHVMRSEGGSVIPRPIGKRLNTYFLIDP